MSKRLVDYLNLQNDNASTAVENENISVSGANENAIQHSSMFYQPFEEETCQKLCRVFEDYMFSTVESTRRKALISLERFVESEKDDEVPNLECLLYASRVANSKILNDPVMFDEMAENVAKCYELNSESSFEAVKHIFKTWNWDCQVGLALVGSIIAERNQVKREQLLSEMDKYILNKGDELHKLLLYKVKAMLVRGTEYSSKLFDIVTNLNSAINNDSQISSIIKQEAPKVFKGNESLFDRVAPRNTLARSAVKDIKQILGFNEIDDVVNKVKLGNEDPEILEQIKRKMCQENTNVERFCGIIRKNHLFNYLPVLEDLVINGNLNIHNKCCICLTYSQMIKNENLKFNNFLSESNLPDDFKHLLKYVHNSNRNNIDYENLDKATDGYFDEDCSSMLKKGIKHTSKYDDEVAKAVLDSFGYLLKKNNEKTSFEILEKLDDLLNDPKSKICGMVNKNSQFLIEFMMYLKNSEMDLDAYPEFFDAMISIVHHCPKTAVKYFYYDIYQKTNDEQRKERVRRMMGDIGVLS